MYAADAVVQPQLWSLKALSRRANANKCLRDSYLLQIDIIQHVQKRRPLFDSSIYLQFRISWAELSFPPVIPQFFRR